MFPGASPDPVGWTSTPGPQSHRVRIFPSVRVFFEKEFNILVCTDSSFTAA